MTPYRIVHEQDAVLALLEVYNRAADRDAVTNAVDRIEKRLADRPTDFTRFIREGLWSTDEGPVRAYYEVREAGRTVHLAGSRCSPGTPAGPAPGRAGRGEGRPVRPRCTRRRAGGDNGSAPPGVVSMRRVSAARPPALSAALAAVVLLSPSAGADEPARPPNVLLIFADDLGWADLGCYGNAFNETPHIDRLAEQGLKFTDAYAACPVCSPSRAALMTGRDPARTGVTNFIPGHYRPFAELLEPAIPLQLPADERTFADLLPPGHVAASFGKWHLGWDPGTEFPGARGFEEWVVSGGNRDPSWTTPEGRTKKGGEFTVDALTDRTETFLRDRAPAGGDGKPWVCVLSHFAVHIPILAEEDLIEKYRAKPDAPGYPSDPAYAAMLEMLDASVGRLLDVLGETGQAENTVVIFASDNGGLRTHFSGEPISHGEAGRVVSSNAPLRGEKGSLYEGGIRVPLIVRWPGTVEPGRACDAVVTTSDLAPTILSVAGVDPPADRELDGVSLVPVLKGECDAARTSVFWHYPHYHHSTPAGAVRSGRYKLIQYYGDGPVELYDLREDVGETRDLAAEMPEQTNELLALLAAYRAETGAKLPAPNPRFDPDRAGEWWSRPYPGRPSEPVLEDYGPPPGPGPSTADELAAASDGG